MKEYLLTVTRGVILTIAIFQMAECTVNPGAYTWKPCTAGALIFAYTKLDDYVKGVEWK